MGKAPSQVTCFTCGHEVRRDFSSIQHRNSDPFRTTWLSNRKTSERLQKQGRPMDPLAPTDLFEARDRQKTHGRIYIGDNVDMLNDRARAAIVNDVGNLRGDKKYDRPPPKGHVEKTLTDYRNEAAPDVPESQHPFGLAKPWDKAPAQMPLTP